MLPRTLAHYVTAIRNYTLPEPELRRQQASKLRRILTSAGSSIPHYHRLFRKLGLRPNDIREVSDISILPTLSKREVVAGYPDSMLPRNLSPAIVKKGSGTTGQSMVFASSEDTLDIRHALFLRRLTVLGYKPWSKVATLWGPSKYWRRQTGEDMVERPTTSIFDYPVMVFGRPIPTVRIVSADIYDTEAEARLLSRTKPAFVFGTPSHLRRVGMALNELDLPMGPSCMIVGNEAVTSTVVREIESRFGSAVVRQYGSAELGGAGGECGFRRGIHVSEDYFVCEVLKDGEQVSPGESGELVMTSLHNSIMPLIRYRTGDIVELDGGGRCECGTCHVRLKSVQGRESDGLVTITGERVLPLAVADHIDSEFGFRDYQLSQLTPVEFLFEGSRKDIGDRARVKGLREYIEEKVGSPVSLKITVRSSEKLWTKSRPVTSAA